MSWSQDYSVPGLMSLLIDLTGKHPEEMLEADLRDRLGIEIVKRERVILDEGMYQEVAGDRITLSDGRVFVPKLVERFSENGNYGCDTYQYFLEGQTPTVSYTGMDRAEPGTDQTVVTVPDCGNCDGCEQGFGCEYPND